jgi:hypothetical protein
MEKALPEISQCIWSACLKCKIHLATSWEHEGRRGSGERGDLPFLSEEHWLLYTRETLSDDERVSRMQASLCALQNVSVVH